MVGADWDLLALAMCWVPSQHVVRAGMAFLASCQPALFTSGYGFTVRIYYSREQVKFSSSGACMRRGDCNPAGTCSNASTASARPLRCKIGMTPDDLAIPRDRFSTQRPRPQTGRRKAQAA
jgi:hypothetical protein